MGLIVLHRVHPSMPPSAMIAAGIAAPETIGFANTIGRIAAAIAPNSETDAGVEPGVGAALVESIMCLFIAGIQVIPHKREPPFCVFTYYDADKCIVTQYQHDRQRLWLLRKLDDISRLVGWPTAEAVAGGCEEAWVKAGEEGRGVPWTRISSPDGN